MEENSIRIGTSGYSYRDWVGPVYPVGTGAGDYFRHYVRLFDTVELNGTFYKLFNPSFFERAASRAPSGFVYTVKAFREITHGKEPSGRQIMERFRESLIPLSESGKLGAVLFQFPWSFKPSSRNERLLREIGVVFRDLNPVVELRNGAWMRRSVTELLRDEGICMCAVDQPDIHGLFSGEVPVTSSVGYLRFHGRNTEKWWKNDAPWQRYDYLYTKEELSEWVPKISRLLSGVDRLYVFTNNHYKGQAVKNALMLREILGLTGPEQSGPFQREMF